MIATSGLVRLALSGPLGTAVTALGNRGLLLAQVPTSRKHAAIFVVGQANSPSPDEAILQARLEAMGYSVGLRDRGSFIEKEGREAGGVVIAPSADPIEGSVVEFQTIPVPVVALSDAALIPLGLADEADVGRPHQSPTGDVVADSLHPLAAGYYGKLQLDPVLRDVGAIRVRAWGRSIFSLPNDPTQSLAMGFAGSSHGRTAGEGPKEAM